MQEPNTEVIVLLFASSIVVIILVAIIGGTLFISQKRKFINRKKISDLRYAFEQEILKTQLEIQSQTFETISRELHDNVGTIVSMANVYLQTLPAMNDLSDQNKIMQAGILLNEAIDALRDISHSLNTEWLEKLSIKEAVENEIDKIRRSNLYEVDVESAGIEFSIPVKDKMIIFRVIQEMLNNIIRHSDASEVAIRILFENSLLKIRIKDNGKGFDSVAVLEKKGMGLQNIFTRARMINMIVELESSPGKGTNYELSYPLIGREKQLETQTQN